MEIDRDRYELKLDIEYSFFENRFRKSSLSNSRGKTCDNKHDQLSSWYIISTTEVIENRYGYKACQQFESTSANWQYMWDFVKHYQKDAVPDADADEQVTAAPRRIRGTAGVKTEDADGFEPVAPQPKMGKKRTWQAQSSEPSTSSAVMVPTPPPPVVPPASAVMVPRPPPTPPPASAVVNNIVAPPPAVKPATSSVQEFDRWELALSSKGVDNDAWMELKMLSTRGDKGMAEGQAIIASFLKQSYNIRNPSGWIHNAVGRAHLD